MLRTPLLAAVIGAFALASCDTLSPRDQTVVGGLTGAAIGIVTAQVLTSDHDWVIIAALTGAVIGALVARNNATGQCAYYAGNGRYRVTTCK